MWMNNMLEYIYRNYSIQHPPSNKRPSSNECPPNSFIFHKHIYSISMIALLEYMYTENNSGLSSFKCSLTASSQKQWPSYKSPNYNVHMRARFLQTNDLV